MNLTDSQFFPYPGDFDPGDGALDLQVLAEAIDAKLVSEFAAFRAVRNKWVLIQSRGSTLGGFASGSTTTNFPATTAISFDTIVYSTHVSSASSIIFLSTADPGYFRIGLYVASNPSGTVNANTYRTSQITANIGTGAPTFGTTVENYYVTNYESSTGGEHQYVEAMIRVENPDFSSVQFLFGHANTGSTLNVNQGSLSWIYRVSGLES
jgi:hypothetical protein